MLCLKSLALSAGAVSITLAQDAAVVEIERDTNTPGRNVVVTVGQCSGTLVAPDIVLTAGHCLKEDARAPKPVLRRVIDCSALSQQAWLQGPVWEDPFTWYTPRFHPLIRVGVSSKAPLMAVRPVAYAVPHCADVALVRIETPVPADMAQTVAIVTTPPRPGQSLARKELRHAGWGVLPTNKRPSEVRTTGPITYWSKNDCHLFALPPRRVNGMRILTGDSGAPMLVPRPGGGEAVIGVLYGKQVLDGQTCGTPQPRLPIHHGTYTPLWRGAIAGTPATDLGRWLQEMVPGAAIGLP